MSVSKFLWKNERCIFAVFVLITALPVLLNTYFPTIDGPSHLHNANLLRQYWFFGNDFLLRFFDLNAHLSSNLPDHLWFAVCGLVLPAPLAEKSLLLFYLLALPFAFRYLLKSSAGDTHSVRLSSYLIFPFVYSFTFRIGFFNFCSGIPVLLWTLGYWIRHRETLTARKLAWLAFLATLVYVFHIFNFLLLGIIVLAHELQYLLHSKKSTGIFARLRMLFIMFTPGLALSVLFYISNRSFRHAPPSYLAKGKLTQMLVQLDPVITLSYEREYRFAQLTGLVLCLLVVLVARDYFKNRQQETFRPKWIFPLLLVLLLYYVFPDWIASGGFISIRWALFFFLLLIILIGSKGLPPKLLIVPVALLMINHLFFIKYHYEQTSVLSEDVNAFAEAQEQMEENSVLLPLNYSGNWMHINCASYMSTEKNIICLDNYEAEKPHFPLLWKQGECVNAYMPGFENRNPPCTNIENYELKTHHRIDYISRYCFDGNMNDSCTVHAGEEIKSKFELIYTSFNRKLQLYKRKPNT
ncbi:MAG: hypothetical protein JWO09_1938 [Bacteroidetes bacterium]|nr:hypothetical protein [Bacteroidota bacterium]